MNAHWIFSITITSINLVLMLINWRILRTIRRPYDPKALKRANKQWRSNLNYEMARMASEKAKRMIDEKNKTENGQ